MNDSEHLSREGRADRERGSALIVVLIVLLMLMGLALSISSTNFISSEAAIHSRDRVALLGAADAGVGIMLDRISDDPSTSLDVNGEATLTWTIGSITVVANAKNLGVDGVDNDGDTLIDVDDDDEFVIRIRSKATDSRGNRRGVETYLRGASHPLFSKAVYIGNRHNIAGYEWVLGPSDEATNNGAADASPASEHTHNGHAFWRSKTWGSDYGITKGDYVEGDVWVNGDIKFTGETNVYGDVTATGTIRGGIVSGEGTANENVAPIEPPDLADLDFDNLVPSQYIITDLNPTNAGGKITNVPHIPFFGFEQYPDGSQNVKPGPLASTPGNFENDNFVLGGSFVSWSNTPLDTSNVVPGTSDLILIKGNLWIDMRPTDFRIQGGGSPTQITIVVEGNLYVADDISYENADDAMLIIVKGADSGDKKDTYADGYRADGTYDAALKNGLYDGDGTELIIEDDDNDGNMDGPKEGMGNIYYGDQSYTHGGVGDGFYYAQNNVYMQTSNTTGGNRGYGIYGFLSAGGIFDMGNGAVDHRDSGSGFVHYRVKYDGRLSDGSVVLPGTPQGQGGGFAGLENTMWREMTPSEINAEWP